MELHHLTTEKSAWDDYVKHHEDGTVYHTLAWKNVVEQHFKKDTHYIYVADKGQICGILPLVVFASNLFGKFMVSYPYVNYGSMLFCNNTAKMLLLEEAKKLLNNSSAEYIELRSMHAEQFSLPVKTKKVTYYLQLPNDTEALMKQFKAKLRSQIRRPLKEGMFAKLHGIEGVQAFYHIFSSKMRDLGTPVYSMDFFRTILAEIPNNSNIVIIYNRDQHPVAAGFVIHYKGIMEIPWAASLREYDRFSPNMLLYFEVLKTAIDQQCTVFDFGRCTKGQGTYRFKKQWGGEEKNLYWYYLLKHGEAMPEVNPDNPKYQMAIKVWQKLPLPVANFVGPSIVKHIP